MNKVLGEVASQLQKNVKKEAEAIESYQDLLNQLHHEFYGLKNGTPDKELFDNLVDMIEELITDELNHQEKLRNAYILITGIEPAKD